jgi:multidrug resistance efflux pump
MVEAQFSSRAAQALAELPHLCRFSGPEEAFWFHLLGVMAGVAGARLAVVLRPSPVEAAQWEPLLAWPGQGVDPAEAKPFATAAQALAPQCAARGEALQPGADASAFLIGVHLQGDEENAVVVLLMIAPGEAAAREALVRLRLLEPLPLLYRLRQQVTHSETAVGHFAAVLDLVAGLNVHRHFLPVAMTLCNELATRHQCERVSLGWLEHGYTRVVAISHSERFDRKMEAIQRLEAVMEEALDQDEVIVWPEPEGARLVTREHAKFSEAARVPSLCSVPLRIDGAPVAVVVCERAGAPFAEVEVRLLALYGEISIRRLADLKKTDRWFGARWLGATREALVELVGPRHAAAKLLSLLALIALPVLSLWKIDYRVDAPFVLRTEDVAYLSAPFNGFIDEVKVDVGDEVKKDQVLASLDVRDLLLEEAGAIAERTRAVGEAEKARGADRPSDINIAEAQAEQARVKLALVQYRRAQSSITSPFDGVVVEGDLRKRIGAPVKQGEVLFRVGRSDGIYVECDAPERDVRELQPGAPGEMAFASAPKTKFPIRLARIEPLAQVKETGNSFLVRAAVESPVESWWRPGMSGVAKFHVAKRPIIWVALHRTVDFLRLKLWW